MRNKKAKKLRKQLLLTSFDVDKERKYTHKEFKDMFSDRQFTAIYRRRKKNELLARRVQHPKIKLTRGEIKREEDYKRMMAFEKPVKITKDEYFKTRPRR